MRCINCNKSRDNSDFFIEVENNQGDENIYFCGDCIDKMYELRKNNSTNSNSNILIDHDSIPSTKSVVEYLDKYIVSQERAKKTLSVAVRNHYKRLQLPNNEAEKVEKSNVLIMGESGTGKTAMIKKIAEYISVPLSIIDTSVTTTDGYMGENVENAIVELYKNADNDKELTEKGIVFFDELDKKKKSSTKGQGKDVGGESVQTSMLKLLEGKSVKVDKDVYIDTTNILFIAGGAFVDLKNIIQNRIKRNTIGFNKKDSKEVQMEDIYKEVTSEDLNEYGLIPELIGRFPIVSHTSKLTEEDLKKIVSEPEDSIMKQFQKLFKVDDISLHFDKHAIEYVARKANNSETGVRGIRKIMENVLEDIQFNIEDYKDQGVKKIQITKNKTQDELTPRFRYSKK